MTNIFLNSRWTVKETKNVDISVDHYHENYFEVLLKPSDSIQITDILEDHVIGQLYRPLKKYTQICIKKSVLQSHMYNIPDSIIRYRVSEHYNDIFDNITNVYNFIITHDLDMDRYHIEKCEGSNGYFWGCDNEAEIFIHNYQIVRKSGMGMRTDKDDISTIHYPLLASNKMVAFAYHIYDYKDFLIFYDRTSFVKWKLGKEADNYNISSDIEGVSHAVQEPIAVPKQPEEDDVPF